MSRTTSVTSDHRPAPAGGPARRSGPGRGRCPRPAPRVDRRRAPAPPIDARSGARVSFVTSPAHTRSQRARSSAASLAVPAASTRSGQNEAPREASRSRIPSWSGPAGRSSGAGALGASRPARSRNRSDTRPSVAPSAPAPIHTRSPLAHSASRSAGRNPRTRAGRTSLSKMEAGIGAPWSLAITPGMASAPPRGRSGPRHAGRERDAERIAEPRRVFDGGVPIVASDAHPYGATLLQHTSEQGVGVAISAGSNLVVSEGPEIAEQVVHAVGVARVPPGGESLQLE